jgi:RNA polymerase sigma-70 factor (ECF subfamily)
MISAIDGTKEPHQVNGHPGGVLRAPDGVVNVWSLDVLDGRIQTIRAVLNPDKLEHLGPVADPYAALDEAKAARRHAR